MILTGNQIPVCAKRYQHLGNRYNTGYMAEGRLGKPLQIHTKKVPHVVRPDRGPLYVETEISLGSRGEDSCRHFYPAEIYHRLPESKAFIRLDNSEADYVIFVNDHNASLPESVRELIKSVYPGSMDAHVKVPIDRGVSLVFTLPMNDSSTFAFVSMLVGHRYKANPSILQFTAKLIFFKEAAERDFLKDYLLIKCPTQSRPRNGEIIVTK